MIYIKIIGLAVGLFLSAGIVQAAETEWPMEEKLRVLTETAIAHDIPPEVLKAIALKESNMMQFQDGEPLVTGDGGIGMMQVTTTDLLLDEEKLKYDTAYNIEAGARILKEKWKLQFSGRIPQINDANPRILEHWYFAVMAYNGLSKRNDPNEASVTPYQTGIYSNIQRFSQVHIKPVPSFPTSYTATGMLQFPDKKLVWDGPLTESTQWFSPGDRVFVMNDEDPALFDYGNLRQTPDITSPAVKVPYYTQFTIKSGPYTASSSWTNQFVLYEVERDGMTGYIASSNVRRLAESAVPNWETRETTDPLKTWTIRFNDQVDPATVHAKHVFLTDNTGLGIAAAITYEEGSQAVSITPETVLRKDRSYTLTVQNLQSQSGKELKKTVIMPFTVQ